MSDSSKGKSAQGCIISVKGDVERATTTSGFCNMNVFIHLISLSASEPTEEPSPF